MESISPDGEQMDWDFDTYQLRFVCSCGEKFDTENAEEQIIEHLTEEEVIGPGADHGVADNVLAVCSCGWTFRDHEATEIREALAKEGEEATVTEIVEEHGGKHEQVCVDDGAVEYHLES